MDVKKAWEPSPELRPSKYYAVYGVVRSTSLYYSKRQSTTRTVFLARTLVKS